MQITYICIIWQVFFKLKLLHCRSCMIPHDHLCLLHFKQLMTYQCFVQDRDVAQRNDESMNTLPKCHFASSFFINKLYYDRYRNNAANPYDYSIVSRWTSPRNLREEMQVRTSNLFCSLTMFTGAYLLSQICRLHLVITSIYIFINAPCVSLFLCMQMSTSLLDVDKIFFPFNIANSHWTLLMIDIASKRIVFYDSCQVCHNLDDEKKLICLISQGCITLSPILK